MATAGDFINGALRKIGQLAEGESPSAETSADALIVLNDLIDAMITDRLMIYATQNQQFTWPANTVSRTLGATGDFVGNAPIQLDPSTYFKDATAGISFPPIDLITEQEYNSIAYKTLTSTYPQYLWANMTHPNITMKVYPVPTMALEWHFVSVLELSQPAVLATSLSVPAGYSRFFRYNLAVELANEFGVEAPPTVQRIAASSKRGLKRLNKQDMDMEMPYGLGGRVRQNIISGV